MLLSYAVNFLRNLLNQTVNRCRDPAEMLMEWVTRGWWVLIYRNV